MSNLEKAPIVLKELRQLKKIESRLQSQWDALADSGKKVQASFLYSLTELEARATELERMLDA
jgi:hypothetical protein